MLPPWSVTTAIDTADKMRLFIWVHVCVCFLCPSRTLAICIFSLNHHPSWVPVSVFPGYCWILSRNKKFRAGFRFQNFRPPESVSRQCEDVSVTHTYVWRTYVCMSTTGGQQAELMGVFNYLYRCCDSGLYLQLG